MTRATLPGTGVRGQSVEAGHVLYNLVQLIDTAQCVAFCLAQNLQCFAVCLCRMQTLVRYNGHRMEAEVHLDNDLCRL